MRGIRGRLVGSYLLVAGVTLSLLLGIAWLIIRQYYYQSAEDILARQCQVSANFFQNYLSNQPLANSAKKLMAGAISTSAQIQIIDANGQLLEDSLSTVDSLSISEGQSVSRKDVMQGLNGQPATWRGYSEVNGEYILAVSYPLWANNQVVGVISCISSLERIHQVLSTIGLLLAGIGVGVALLVAILSLRLANTIIAPILNITGVAKRIAAGQFQFKATKKYNDEIGQLAETLNYMAGELANAEKHKNDFIASISHELRTPLTSIKGWVVTLRTGDLANYEEVQEGLQIVEQEADRLKGLVDDLLDFSQLEAGSIKLNLSPVDLSELLRKLARYITPRAQEKQIEVSLSVNGELPLVQVDSQRLQQVLINLLDNALKFTPLHGRIGINCHADQSLNIMITDTGIGIPETDLEKVTQRFYKGHAHYPGSGLGLAICQEILELHGGQLLVESRADGGTSVTCVLPL